MANSCPLRENPKPISIDANIMPRKVCYGTLLVSIAKKKIPIFILRLSLSMLRLT